MATLTEEVDLLRRIPLFAAIDPGKLKLLAFASERLSYDDGQVVFKQGDVGDSAYVVVDGTADVVVSTDTGDITVAELGKHEVIGEIAILCDVPRTASIRANGKLVTLKIKKEHFLGLISDFPELGVEIMRELASRLSNTTSELTETKRELKKAHAS